MAAYSETCEATVLTGNTEGVLETLFQDEVQLEIDVPLFYIKSGEEEIGYYLEHTIKPALETATAQHLSDMNAHVEDVCLPAVDAYVESSAKPEITAHLAAGKADFDEHVVEQKTAVSALVGEAEDFAVAAEASAGNALSGAGQAAASAAESSGFADKAKDWAIKTDGMTDDTDYSSKYYAQQASTVFGQISSAVSAGLVQLANAGNALRTTQATNCLLEIPSDVQISRDGTVMTLSSGSRLYKPDGSFYTPGAALSVDVAGWSSGETFAVVYRGDTQVLQGCPLAACFAQEAEPATVPCLWYNPEENSLKFCGSDGVWTVCSLPLFWVRDGKPVQIFNGFSVVGGCVFVLPGVKGLVPSGRNADGSLNNLTAVTEDVLTVSAADGETTLFLSADNSGKFTTAHCFLTTETAPATGYVFYSSEENRNYASLDPFLLLIAGRVSAVSGKVVSFVPKLSLRVVDWNDFQTERQNLRSDIDEASSNLEASLSALTATVDNLVKDYNSATAIPKCIQLKVPGRSLPLKLQYGFISGKGIVTFPQAYSGSDTYSVIVNKCLASTGSQRDSYVTAYSASSITIEANGTISFWLAVGY